ncbi:MAG: M15 family metallopeptidase [Candidatus Eremiobacteraeota bacterium]|nr:M15 family metallopeptidase [Candidatus Eremiobacteraeota bacterium]
MKRLALVITIIFILALGLPGYLSAQMVSTEEELFARKPPAASGSMLSVIGDYELGGESITVLERNNALYLLYHKKYIPLRPMGAASWSLPQDNALGTWKLEFLSSKTGAVTVCKAGGRYFQRVPHTGRINPSKPVKDLREEALKAKPPAEEGQFLAPDLVEMITLDPSVQLDIRYATANNFMGAPFYSCAKAYLQRPAAEALARVSKKLKAHGLGLVIFDAYRPWYVTRMFWDGTPDSQKKFVADPKTGSVHNRGVAADVTLYDLKTGKALDMGGFYDEFGERSSPGYQGGTSLSRWNREVLRFLMGQEGFTVYPYEWWHFNYRDSDRYPIMNIPFEDLRAKKIPGN